MYVDSLGKVIFQLSLVHWNSCRNCFNLIIPVRTEKQATSIKFSNAIYDREI